MKKMGMFKKIIGVFALSIAITAASNTTVFAEQVSENAVDVTAMDDATEELNIDSDYEMEADLTEEESGVGAFVNRCYKVTLGRDADPNGYDTWVTSLKEGKACGAQVAYGFLFSNEYINQKKSDADFINDMYQMFFGRSADEGGFNLWMAEMKKGVTRENVFAGFANSVEFDDLCATYDVTTGYYVVGADVNKQGGVNCFVARMYKVILGRRSEREGQQTWVKQLMSNQMDGANVAYGFVFSKEYVNKGLSNDEFAENMYESFFGRSSDEGGKSYWVEKLSKGAGRDEVFAGFTNSKEFTELCGSYGIDRGTYTCKTKTKNVLDNAIYYNITTDAVTNYLTYEYNDKGVVTKQNEFSSVGGPLVSIMNYDEHGNMLGACNANGKEITKYTNEYDANGRIIKASWQYTSGNAMGGAIIYEYDNNGKLKYRKLSDGYDVTEYDNHGNEIRHTSYYSQDSTALAISYKKGDIALDEKWINEYDEHGNIIKHVLDGSDSPNFVYNNEYDANGNLVKVTCYQRGKLYQIFNYKMLTYSE